MPDAGLAVSDASAAGFLLAGRPVRDAESGELGIVQRLRPVSQGAEKDCADHQRPESSTFANPSDAPPGDAESCSGDQQLDVLFPSGEVRPRTRGTLEPWTRGIFVRVLGTGQRGQIVRVIQRTPPASHPYLVRLEDGSSLTLGIHDVRFEGKEACLFSSPPIQDEPSESERCALTLVPGAWDFKYASQQHKQEVLRVDMKIATDGALRGAGSDAVGQFDWVCREHDSRLDVSWRYSSGCASIGRGELAGTWSLHDLGDSPRWAMVDREGRAFIAGTVAGVFRHVTTNGDHVTKDSSWEYVESPAGTSRRVLAHSADLLCWDDGGMWRRIMVEECKDIAALNGAGLDFDPPRTSERGDDGSCEVFGLAIDGPGSLRVNLKASDVGPLPDVMKTELRVDGRIVEAARSRFAAALSKGKRKRSSVKGELFFEDVVLSDGSAVSLRFGGEYGGFGWADLIEAPPGFPEALLAASGLYLPSNPLRPMHVSGWIASDGRSVEGEFTEGPVVTVAGKTASSIKIVTAGRRTTVSLRPYADDDFATIDVKGPAMMRYTFFQTEETYDTMTILGVEYSGKELPPPLVVPEGQVVRMTWKTDASTTDEGWEFTAVSGMSWVHLPQHSVEFGAREAPWNCGDACESFEAPLLHMPSNPHGSSQFAASALEGHVVVCLAEAPAEENGEESKDADTDLAWDGLQVAAKHATDAGARAVIFVSPRPAHKGALRAPCGDEPDEPDEGGAHLVPAVLVGHALGAEILRALDAGQLVVAGPPRDRFRMHLASPVRLGGSRRFAQLCVGSPNVLRAVLGDEWRGKQGLEAKMLPASTGDAAAGPVPTSDRVTPMPLLAPFTPEAFAKLARPVISAMRGCPSDSEFVEGLLRWHSDSPTGSMEGHLRHLIRQLTPLALPEAAVLPPVPPPQSRRVWDEFFKGRCLGAGSFGAVCQAWDRCTGSVVAVKKIRLKEKNNVSKKDVIREFGLLRDMSHPGLLRVLDLYVAGKKLFIVAESASEGELSRYIVAKSNVDESWVAAIARQVLSACRFLHKKHIVHHDIKPSNVLVTHCRLPAPESHVQRVVVCDFGLAQVEKFIAQEAREQAGAGNGTKYYRPPESAKGLSGPKTDVYSIGITLFEILAGGHAPEPIDDEGEPGEVDWDLLGHCTAPAVRLTEALIARDVAQRASCEEALKHEWLWPCGRWSPGDGAAAGEQRAGAPSRGKAKASLSVAVARLCNQPDDFLSKVARNLFVAVLDRVHLEDACRAFSLMDADCDGVLSESDMVTSFKACGVDERSAHKALVIADVHGRGELEFRQFAAMYIDVHALPSSMAHGIAEKLFSQLCHSTGSLSVQALFSWLDCTDDSDVSNFVTLFHQHDVNGDGRLTKDEFFALLDMVPLPEWSPPQPPEKPYEVVRLLRGAPSSASVEGRTVTAWAFVTFGQPALARSSGKWYYELEILQCEYPQVGWADRGFEFDCDAGDDGVGDDKYSWAADGVRRMRWHDGGEAWDEKWSRPVVVGCAIDLDGSPVSMSFSTNGRWAAAPVFEGFEFLDWIFPAATGIHAGTFRFDPGHWTHRPPDDSYMPLRFNEVHVVRTASP